MISDLHPPGVARLSAGARPVHTHAESTVSVLNPLNLDTTPGLVGVLVQYSLRASWIDMARDLARARSVLITTARLERCERPGLCLLRKGEDQQVAIGRHGHQ